MALTREQANKIADDNEKGSGLGAGTWSGISREEWINRAVGGAPNNPGNASPDRVAAPSLGPLVDNGGTATHQPAASGGFDTGAGVKRGAPAVSDSPPPTPAPAPAAPPPPAPAAPASSPGPMGAASPMASLQAAADPGAGWAQSTAQSQLRPGLGAASLSPMQRLFSGRAY